MESKDILNLIYSNMSIDKKFNKLIQLVKYDFNFDDELFDAIYFLLKNLIIPNGVIPNNYNEILYLLSRMNNEQCLKISELAKSDGLLYDLILNREYTTDDYKKLQYKIKNINLLHGLLYLKSNEKNSEIIIDELIKKGAYRNILYVPNSINIDNFYDKIFKLNTLVNNIQIKQVSAELPYSKKVMKNKHNINNFISMKNYFYNSNFSKKLNYYTKLDLFILDENPKLKSYLKNTIQGYSSLIYSGKSNYLRRTILNTKTEFKKLISNNDIICIESLNGILDKTLIYKLNLYSKKKIIKNSYNSIIKNKLYYDFIDGYNIFSFIDTKSILNMGYNYMFMSYLHDIYKEFGKNELINFLKELSKNKFKELLKINFIFVKSLDEDLVNNLDTLELLKPHLTFKLDKIDDRYVYNDSLNLTDEQIKVLDFITI